MEIWDAYDKDRKLVSIDLIRGEKIPDGLYHMVCEVIVRHVTGDFLLMQRDNNKPTFPGIFEATAGGSAIKGENEDQCIKRELFEETGIEGDDFKLIDIIVSDSNNCIYYEYYCETDCEKNSIRLQEGETIGYKWVSKNQLQNMMERREIVPVTKARMLKYFNSELCYM